ncbi:MAG: HlyD family efflux transporter periplasmic adaptor subunit [Patescibacteria group bacterium]
MTVNRTRHHPIWPRSLAVLLLGTLFISLLWQGVLVAIGFLFPESTTSSYGTLEITDRVQVVFLRHERLLPAPGSGIFRPILSAGERIPVRGAFGELHSGGRGWRKCRTKDAGLLVYTSDGLEDALQPERAMTEPDRAYAKAIAGRMRRLGGRGRRVRTGEPLARIIEDTEEFLLVRMPPMRAALKPGGRLWAREDESLVPLSVVKTVSSRQGTMAVLRTDRFPPAWLAVRQSRLDLVWERYTGTLVPSRFLRRRNGRSGLIVMVRGKPSFEPVTVLAYNRGQAVVEGIREGEILLPR